MTGAKYLFFDLDGTLADTDGDIRLAWREAMAAMGLECPGFEEKFVAGPPIEAMAKTLFPDSYTDEMGAELRRRFGEAYDACGFPSTAEYPGVLDAVRRLKETGRRVFIATNKRFAGAEAVAAKFGWGAVFEKLYAGDMKKDDPAVGKMDKTRLLAYAMAEIGAAPEECAMIGDTANDFDAARANGMKCVAVSWGYGKPGEAEKADATANDAAELLAALGCKPPKPKPPRKRRKYKAVIAYDGTAYSGWQFQTNAVGIQQVVEKALEYVEGAPVRVSGSSRTDAGVHAKGFVATFHLTKPIPPKNLVRAANSQMPAAVRFLRAAYAKEDFNAQLSAFGKEYRYQVYQADIMPPHLVPYWTFCHRPLDVDAMRRGAAYFVGRHDFRSFAATSDRKIANAVRNVFSFDVKKTGHRITFIVRGDGFLYKQVRSMVGFLIAVGKGIEPPEAVKELLEAATPRTARVETAPARGLFLWKVFYKEIPCSTTSQTP